MLNPPPRIITQYALESLSRRATSLPRGRANLNVHPQLDDPVQRLFNAMEPGTYVRPHRHARPDGWELMMVVSGRFAILLFDEHGQVTERFDLGENAIAAVEIPPFTWHSVVSLLPATVMFEVKPGPYLPLSDKDFAHWAPPEGDAECGHFVEWYTAARPGDTAPGFPVNSSD